jgi:hypothetical protein
MFLRIVLLLLVGVAAASGASATGSAFPPPLDSYGDADLPSVLDRLIHRARVEPFNVIGTLIFLGAITHTFMVAGIRRAGHRYEHEYARLDAASGERDEATTRELERLRFKSTALHFLGEIEAVFGIWLVPLFLALGAMKGLGTAVAYLDNVNYNEAVFVTVIMAIAGTRPVILFAEAGLARGARLLGGTTTAWWLVILTGGPLLGSLITEPAAMTLCALLLGQRFYAQNPSMKLRYATLGLLFVNISVGGTLTHFAAPPVVMVANKWGLGAMEMLTSYGWKAALGIVISNALYWAYFRRELNGLTAQTQTDAPRPVPVFITIVHLLFLVWSVLNAHHSALIIGGFLFFLAFVATTEPHQDVVGIRGPLLVGFFLAALVAHGGCQQWWIGPILRDLGPWPLMLGSIALTAFNDNAAITYLASLVPDFSEQMKYAVLAGAVTGGGLTVIANAPNPAGQSLLQRYFGEDGISPGKLFLSALAPTFIVGAVFMIFRG